ncbi:MAG: serpin family protein [Rhodothermales bacterium]
MKSTLHSLIRRLPVVALAGALAVLMPACDTVEDDSPDLRALTANERSLVTAGNAFGLDLYHTLSADAPQDNLFISPVSVAQALGMTANGAAGETLDEMVAVLGTGSMTLPELNQASQSLTAFLTGLDPLVQTSIANSIWHEATFRPEAAFIETNRTYYDATVKALDFASPQSVQTINNWVADKTNDRIDEIIDAIPPEAVMYLINAIYFKGTWTYQFKEEATLNEPFTNRDGTQAIAPLMRMKAEVPYQSRDAFDAIDLPYGNGQYRMTVVLPASTASLPELIAGLDADAWSALVDGFAPAEVNVVLPRFRVAYQQALNDALKALGMERAFEGGVADFSGIEKDRGRELFISRVLHKSFVEVNEEGTEAAAVTAVEVGTTSVGPNDGQEIFFRADRPFVYAIREAHSGAILFIGTLNSL